MTTSYIIGKSPLINPCLNCVISVVCSEICKDKVLWNREHPPKKSSRIKLKRRMKRENKK